jgi:hypothetical protein
MKSSEYASGFKQDKVSVEGHLADVKMPDQLLERHTFLFPDYFDKPFPAQDRIHVSTPHPG